MDKAVYFDHFEAHVDDINGYCEFLKKLFRGGKSKLVNENGTSMYLSPDGLAVEIKKKGSDSLPVRSGICLPCIRLENPEELIEKELGLKIEQSFDLPDGKVHFFTDHENITWHAKSYVHKDRTVDF